MLKLPLLSPVSMYAMFWFLDLQMVNIGLRVLARPDQSALPHIYQQLGTDYDDRVLPSIINEVCMLCWQVSLVNRNS